jgi:hypothetical protein
MRVAYAIAIISVISFTGLSADAFAQGSGSKAYAQASKGHVTYRQAWRICKAMLDREAVPRGSNDRHLRGGACLAKFGYNL